MKFLIVNSFHRDDKGDAALVHILIDQLLAINPKADISISSMEDPKQYEMFYKGKNIGSFELYSSSHLHSFPTHLFIKIYLFFALSVIGFFGGKFSWLLPKDARRIYEEIRSSDLIVSVGGGYFLTNRGWGSRMHILFALQNLMLGKRLGRKVVTAPVSVGPFQNKFEARYTASRLRKLDLALLREDISKQYFVDEKGNLPVNIKRAPDSAFAFSPKGEFDIRSLAGAKSKERVLAFSVRNWMGKEQQARYEQAHADLIDHVAKEYPDIKIIFIPQCTFPHQDDDDRVVAKRILDLSKTKKLVIIEEDLGYQKVKLAYKQADFIVGTRFHSMVFGLAYNVPGVAIEYEPKTRGIMRDLGLEDWVIPIGSISSEKLINLFDLLLEEKNSYKKHLLDVMPKYVESANSVIGLFADIIKK